MSKITIFINDQIVSKETVDRWELKRLKHQYNYLIKKNFSLNKSLLELNTIDEARHELSLQKTLYNPEKFRKLLKNRYTIGNLFSKIAILFSRGKRKYSSTEFFISETKLTAEEVMESISNIMLENTKEHLYMNLATNPDHFVLLSTEKNVQEVIEITGGSPLPTRFFAHYGDLEGLTSKLSNGYYLQISGAAKLEDGTIIGGIRHQLKKEDNGLRFKALVEFPAVLPNYMIEQHQYHLACEFRQWLNYLVENNDFSYLTAR